MPQMTPSQARVLDPILTAVARGYRSQAAYVAQALFPIVTVGQRGGRIMKFGPDAFKLVSTFRAPGANTKRIQLGYSDQSYGLSDHSLEGSVPRELQDEAEAVPGIDLGANAVRVVQDLMELEREKIACDLAQDANQYAAENKDTLVGDEQWSDPDSNPEADIDAAKEVIRSKTGVKPNRLVVGPKVLQALKRHPDLIAKISDSEDKVLRVEQLQKFLDIDEIVEAGAMYHNGTNFVDVWGNKALLAYTTPASMQEMGSPSFGYTYRLQGYPFVEEAYFERNPKTWFYPYTDAYQPQLVGPSAGFLWSGAVA
jgi:Phage major capsid protein E